MNKLLIIDFGSNLVGQIKERLESLNICYECVKHDYDFSLLDNDVKGIILSGSPDAIYDNGRRCQDEFFKTKLPVLGICYGHQISNEIFGGEVTKSSTPEYDKKSKFIVDVDNPLFKGMKHEQNVSMYHYDEVVRLGEGFISLGHTDKCKYAASYNSEYNIYTVQFHPESKKYGEYSEEYFINFANICKL